MPGVQITLPQVKEHPDARPSSCPYCARVAFHKHARIQKPIKNPLRQVRYDNRILLRQLRQDIQELP